MGHATSTLRYVIHCAALEDHAMASRYRSPSTAPLNNWTVRRFHGTAHRRRLREKAGGASVSARGAMPRAFVRTRERRYRSYRVRFCARPRVARAFPDAGRSNPTHKCPTLRAHAGAGRAARKGLRTARGRRPRRTSAWPDGPARRL